jgi:NADH dehydrogenase
MGEIQEDLASFAAEELRGRGIEVRTSTQVEEVREDAVVLKGGEVIRARTCVWTAGVKPHPVVAKLGLPLDDGGRIRTGQDMRVEGHPEVWAIGDAAGIPDPVDRSNPAPPTAQHALREGRLVAKNVVAALGAGGRIRPFKYKTLGAFVDMGRFQAVASTMGIKWRGFPAWILARTYHLMLMPGTKRKYRLLVDWNVDLLFGRDTSDLGQLGHPPELGEDSTGGLVEQSSGGTEGVEEPAARP